MTSARILVTGGAGYIGSHATLALLQSGHEVVVLDNLSNSSPASLARLAQIAGRAAGFVQGDVRDAALVQRLLAEHRIGAVLHFAGLKAVSESVRQPLRYYDHNVAGTLALCQAMAAAGCSGWCSVLRPPCMAIAPPCRSARQRRPGGRPTRMAAPS